MSPKYKIRMLPNLSSRSGSIAKMPGDHRVLSLHHAALPSASSTSSCGKPANTGPKGGEIVRPLQGALPTSPSPPEGPPWPWEYAQPQWVPPGDEVHSARATPFLGPGASPSEGYRAQAHACVLQISPQQTQIPVKMLLVQVSQTCLLLKNRLVIILVS